jgi:hypothetical protein
VLRGKTRCGRDSGGCWTAACASHFSVHRVDRIDRDGNADRRQLSLRSPGRPADCRRTRSRSPRSYSGAARRRLGRIAVAARRTLRLTRRSSSSQPPPRSARCSTRGALRPSQTVRQGWGGLGSPERAHSAKFRSRERRLPQGDRGGVGSSGAGARWCGTPGAWGRSPHRVSAW